MNLSEMTIEQLLEAQQPQLNKLYARQPLTEAENALYQQIIAEATRRHDALRQAELDERAERFAAEERVNPAPTTCIACGKPASYVRQVGCNSQQPSGKWYTEFGVCAEHFGIGLTEPVPHPEYCLCNQCAADRVAFCGYD